MSPSDPSIDPPDKTPEVRPPDAGDLPPLVLPVDPAIVARSSAGLPPLVLPVDPATLARFYQGLLPSVLPVDPATLKSYGGLPPSVLPVNPAALTWQGAGLPPMVLPALRRPRPHPGFWWSVLWCLGFLIFAQLIPGIVVMVVGLAVEMALAPSADLALKELQQQAGKAFEERLLIPLVGSTVLAGILVAWLAIRLIVGRDWQRHLALRRPSAAHVLLVVAGLPGMLVMGDVLHTLASQVLPGFRDWGLDDITKFQEQTKSWPWWVVVLLVGVGPGVGEELFCRGFLGRGLVGRYGPLIGVLFTSFFFGLLHVDPPHAVAAFGMGLVLHFVYLTTRSLWMPMLLHFLNNSASVAEDWPVAKALDDGMTNMPVLVAAAALLLFGAVGWALYRSRARLVPTFESRGVPWQPPFPGVEYPPPGSHTTVIHPWPDALAWGLVLGAWAMFGAAVYVAAGGI